MIQLLKGQEKIEQQTPNRMENQSLELPIEIWQLIFSNLQIGYLLMARSVCYTWFRCIGVVDPFDAAAYLASVGDSHLLSYLTKRGYKLHDYALSYAAYGGHIEILRSAISDLRLGDSIMAFSMAIAGNQLETLIFLLNTLSDITRDKTRNTVLIREMCKYGRIDMIRYMADRYSPDLLLNVRITSHPDSLQLTSLLPSAEMFDTHRADALRHGNNAVIDALKPDAYFSTTKPEMYGWHQSARVRWVLEHNITDWKWARTEMGCNRECAELMVKKVYQESEKRGDAFLRDLLLYVAKGHGCFSVFTMCVDWYEGHMPSSLINDTMKQIIKCQHPPLYRELEYLAKTYREHIKYEGKFYSLHMLKAYERCGFPLDYALMTRLMVRDARPDIVEFITKRGYQPNESDLARVCHHRTNIQIKRLLTQGIQYSTNVLFESLAMNRSKTVKILIRRGCPVTTEFVRAATTNSTLFIWLIKQGHPINDEMWIALILDRNLHTVKKLQDMGYKMSRRVAHFQYCNQIQNDIGYSIANITIPINLDNERP